MSGGGGDKKGMPNIEHQTIYIFKSISRIERHNVFNYSYTFLNILFHPPFFLSLSLLSLFNYSHLNKRTFHHPISPTSTPYVVTRIVEAKVAIDGSYNNAERCSHKRHIAHAYTFLLTGKLYRSIKKKNNRKKKGKREKEYFEWGKKCKSRAPFLATFLSLILIIHIYF